MGVIEKVTISKLSFPLDGVYRYDAQVWRSIDGGKTFYHCGDGRYCKTRKEAKEYARKIEGR